MMPDFTPGPWEIGHNGIIKAVYARPGMDDSQLMPVLLLGDGVNMEGNARLIAAAPDLLAACKALVQLAQDAFYTHGAAEVQMGLAAITRAEGRTDARST